jgi:hypothetical protein
VLWDVLEDGGAISIELGVDILPVVGDLTVQLGEFCEELGDDPLRVIHGLHTRAGPVAHGRFLLSLN